MAQTFRVTGVDRNSGADRTFFASAPSEDAAREFASRRGVIVSAIEPVDPSAVPHGVPVLPATERRSIRAEWVPCLDFSFLPPSGYFGLGLLGVVIGLVIYGFSLVSAANRMQEMGVVNVSSLMRGHALWTTVAVSIGVAGATMIVLGCIRFASYQRAGDG